MSAVLPEQRSSYAPLHRPHACRDRHGGLWPSSQHANTYRHPSPYRYPSAAGAVLGLVSRDRLGGTEQHSNVRLPFDHLFKAEPGQFLYISAQNSDSSGWIECEILLNGKTVKQAKSTGGYTIATCSMGL